MFQKIFFIFFSFLLISSSLKAEIVFDNRPLARVAETTISLRDLIREMDLFLYTRHPDAFSNEEARCHFYQSHWKEYLEEQIHLELLKLEALEMKLEISPSQVNEEIVSRYGSDWVVRLSAVGLLPEEVQSSLKKELMAMRVSWYGYYQKAFLRAGPKNVLHLYEELLRQHPPKEKWNYEVWTLKSKEPAELQKLVETLSKKINSKEFSLPEVEESCAKGAVELKKGVNLSVEDSHLSLPHKLALKSMENQGAQFYFSPVEAKEGDPGMVRLFHLKDHLKEAVPKFEELYDLLHSRLVQQMALEEKKAYFNHLMDKRGYGDISPYFPLPERYEPFRIE